jgi:hypothetical protein
MFMHAKKLLLNDNTFFPIEYLYNPLRRRQICLNFLAVESLQDISLFLFLQTFV